MTNFISEDNALVTEGVLVYEAALKRMHEEIRRA